VISVILWLGTDLTRSRVTAQEVALIRAAAEIRVAVAVAHLWLEEYVSGDVGGNLEQVWRNLDRAESLARSMLDGGSPRPDGRGLTPLEGPALRQRAQTLLNHIVELRRRARLRQEGSARGEDTGIGSSSDAEFDSLFGQLSREAQALERAVERQMEMDQRRMSWLLGTLLLGWTSLIVIAAAGLWSRERRRLVAEAALRHSEAQLAQSQKLEAVGRLAGGLAHDINNYVTAITSQCELVRMKAEPRVAEKMDMVIATAGKITSLVRRLLAFSRQQPMAVRVIGLDEVVEGLGGMMKRLIGEDVELRTYLARDLWAVRVDPAQVEQILVNLVVNAREAMPRGGKITVETANVSLDREYLRSNPTVPPGEYVLLAVSDSGSGIPREIRDRIFEPFFTTKEGTEARGLGLSSVYGIVKQSGGHVAVYSEEGKGTTFRVYLPRTTEPLTPAAPAPTAAPVGGAESVLLIEDNDELRLATRGILDVLGYRVTAAANGTEALDVFDRMKGRVDLVICDVVMPGMSGPEVVERLRARKPDLPALFMSGYTDNVVVRHGILEGDLEFLEKPYSADRLAAKVREVLGAAG
jgi:signal transduction histidine kinase